jgi:hypothetical protein
VSLIPLSLAAMLALLPACDADEAATPPPPPEAEIAVGPVARAVVVGQREACDCTRARIDQGTAALTQAIGDRAIPVEQLEADNPEHREQVELLRALRPLMVAPGIYLFDANDELVGMTQGETSAEELAELMGAPARKP